MPTHAPWSLHAIERVKQEPVPFERLIAEMMALVPPGRAYRESARNAERQRETDNGPRTLTTIDPDTQRMRQIRSGQRVIAYSALREMVKRGRLRSYDEDEVEMVTLGPEDFDTITARRPGSMSDTTKAYLRAVRNGAVEVEPLIQAFMLLVPRPEAIAKARDDREEARLRDKKKRKTDKSYRKNVTEEMDWATGARRVATKGLATSIKSGRLKSWGDGADRFIAKGPSWYDPDAPDS